MLTTLLLITSAKSYAQTPAPPREKSAFEQTLEQNQMVETRERTISVNGIRYREVFYEGNKNYVRLLGRDDDKAELDCNFKMPFTPPLIETGFTIHRRAKVFVSFLKESCADSGGGRSRTVIELDPRIGISFADDPKSTIKNKKIWLNPLQLTPGFSGEW